MATAAVGGHPSLLDRWQPRDEAWHRREPSPFAGRPGRPLLIGACPRSGTTLLRGMLNNHPDLAIPPETDFVIPLWKKRTEFGDLRHEGNRRRLAEWVFDEDGHGGKRIRGEISRDEAIERVMAAAPTLGSIYAALFAMFAERKGKPRWGDKRPAYAGFVDMLFEVFPDAQYVNLIRDPRGAVSSMKGLGWYRKNVAAAASLATWEMSVRRTDAAAARLRPDQLLDLRYEDMVRDPHGTLERICDFAGLRAGDAVEQMITRPRRGRFREGWHERVAEEITTEPIANWRERLAAREVALVEDRQAERLARFGYRATLEEGERPRAADVEEFEQQLKRRRRKWRRYAVGELRRRLTYRRPVARQI